MLESVCSLGGGIKIGARWDGPKELDRVLAANKASLIDFIEPNYPCESPNLPESASLPIYVHCSQNGLASAFGLNADVCDFVRRMIAKTGSPWAGEHLTWLAPGQRGGLGYNINPLFSAGLVDQTCRNVSGLSALYECKLALELGTLYTNGVDATAEAEFLTTIASKTDSWIIFDVAHWFASARNLGRTFDDGLNRIDFDRVVEIHVAGVRRSQSDDVWHDAHHLVPDGQILDCLAQIAERSTKLRAVTLELDADVGKSEFLSSLDLIRQTLS